MRFRKLRIAFSVTCGIACVLLIAFWVRSYSWSNILVSSGWNGIVVISNGQVFYGANFSWAGPNKQEESLFWYGGNWYRIQNIWNPDVGKVQIYGYKRRLPIWPFAICAFTAMTFPWLFWLRRGFSLRTLLIAMTLIAVVLGLIVWASK